MAKMDPVTGAIVSAVMVNLINGVFNLASTIGMSQNQVGAWVQQQRDMFYSGEELPKPPEVPTEDEGGK